MISQRKFFWATSLFVATVQLPALSNACEVPTPYISHNYGSQMTEGCLVAINDEVSIQSNVLLNFDVTEVKRNIISEFWAPFRDTLAEQRGAIGFIRLISYDAKKMEILIDNASEADVAKKALQLYLTEAGLNHQSFNISSDAGILTIEPSEDWLSRRTEVLINQSISIMQERFDEVDVAVQISPTGLNALNVTTENFALTERGNQFLINPGKFSINEIIFTSDTIPERLLASTKVVRSEDEEKYYIISLDALISNEKLFQVVPSLAENNFAALTINFDDSSRSFFDYTSEHVGRPLAFVLDDVVIAAPNIMEPISNGNMQISGLRSLEVATVYSILMNSPALPIRFSIVGEGFSDRL